MSKYKEAERIANQARRAISDFCINECRAYCCRKGYIMVRENQLKQISTDEQRKILKKEEKIKEFPFSGKFQIDFTNSLGGCPALKNNKCKIHKNPIRPRVCHEFPIFVFVDHIKISSKCPAYKNNKLYPFIKKFKELGYKITN
ncbi:MAG TPA: YkgJ family cysteine cluster protein [Candidatus Nanoarchaeia archaeon]|nr:YkgJ family cysteine cluster protein [Candidatus Nanoarchaeia archaeon]